MSKQLNYTFGQTLEFSCTVENGEISSQELVSSGPDAILTLRMDAGAYLSPDTLERIARDIREAQTGNKLKLATEGLTDNMIGRVKETMANNPVLSQASAGVAYSLAEYELNKLGYTMYEQNVTFVEPVVEETIPSPVEFDDDDDDDWDDDYDDGWGYWTDDYDEDDDDDDEDFEDEEDDDE